MIVPGCGWFQVKRDSFTSHQVTFTAGGQTWPKTCEGGGYFHLLYNSKTDLITDHYTTLKLFNIYIDMHDFFLFHNADGMRKSHFV